MSNGFYNDIMFADNVDFSGVHDSTGQAIARVTLDGQLLIGSATGRNIQVNTLTAGAGITITNGAGSITIASSGSSVDLHVARYIVSQGGSPDGANYTSIAAGIAAAVGAGSPQTVYIQPGTYTENITLSPGIDLCACNCDGLNANVTILGKVTCTSAGSYSLSGIRFRTNGDNFFVCSGAAAINVFFSNCYFVTNGNTGFNLSNANANITVLQGLSDTLAADALFAITGSSLSMDGHINIGSVQGTSTVSSGTFSSFSSSLAFVLTSSSSGQIKLRYTSMPLGQTCINHNATSGTSFVFGCIIEGGASTSITIGAGATLSVINTIVDTATSAATAAISGAGTLKFCNLSNEDIGTVLTVTTQTPLIASNDAVQVKAPGAYPYTTVPQDNVILVDTSSARTITPYASPATGQMHRIKDNVGSAASNNITITPSGKNIDGAASVVINTNYGSVDICYQGTQWVIL